MVKSTTLVICNLSGLSTVVKHASENSSRNQWRAKYTVKKVSDIPAGDGKVANLFLRCRASIFPKCITVFIDVKQIFEWDLRSLTSQVVSREKIFSYLALSFKLFA